MSQLIPSWSVFLLLVTVFLAAMLPPVRGDDFTAAVAEAFPVSVNRSVLLDLLFFATGQEVPVVLRFTHRHEVWVLLTRKELLLLLSHLVEL